MAGVEFDGNAARPSCPDQLFDFREASADVNRLSYRTAVKGQTYRLLNEDTGPPEEWTWKVQGGPMVFAPFKADTDYWAADHQFMLNFRVNDLDGLLEQLNASGIDVIVKPEWDSPETGRFARIHDPEGNPIELWEAPA